VTLAHVTMRAPEPQAIGMPALTNAVVDAVRAPQTAVATSGHRMTPATRCGDSRARNTVVTAREKCAISSGPPKRFPRLGGPNQGR
jgi:hypothetical protein